MLTSFHLAVVALLCMNAVQGSDSYDPNNFNAAAFHRHKEHIISELKEEFPEHTIAAMSDNELEFQYFRAHDFDKNYSLDGLELMAAMGHMSDESEHSHIYIDKLSEKVDAIIEAGDSNKDGLLDYPEYRRGRLNKGNF